MECRTVSSSCSSKLVKGGLAAALALSISTTAIPADASPAGMDPIKYPTFADTSRLTLNGTAAVVNAGNPARKVLRLTNGGSRQIGSAWANQQIDVNHSFDTSFTVFLHNGKPPADGVAFLVQGSGPLALGGWGGGIGYRGIKNSVAVEFDDFKNDPDSSNNHIAVVLRGNPDFHYAVAESALPLFGKPFRARIVYTAKNAGLKVYLRGADKNSSEQLMLDTRVDLAAQVGGNKAWVGFTGATGSAHSKQDINSWALDTPGA